MSKIDKYNLVASTPSPVIGTAEVEKNLQLTTSIIAVTGLIQGAVTAAGQGVADATIKVFSSNGAPLYHANSGPNGQFVIPNIQSGSYVITAVKQGYLLPLAASVAVVANVPTIVNLVLVPDPDAVLNTLYGKIKNPPPTAGPVSGAIVNVYQVEESAQTLVATTRSNADGQYLFPYLPNGNYIVSATKENYLPGQSATVTLSNAVKSSIDVILTPTIAASYGTVSGFITDAATNLPIANAVVGLYQIVNNVEVLVQQTKTNLNGRYLFGSVLDGQYLVKSFAQTTAPVVS